MLGKCSKNQNGNLRWHLPLGVRPPPFNGTNFQTFFHPTFFLLQLNPTYESFSDVESCGGPIFKVVLEC